MQDAFNDSLQTSDASVYSFPVFFAYSWCLLSTVHGPILSRSFSLHLCAHHYRFSSCSHMIIVYFLFSFEPLSAFSLSSMHGYASMSLNFFMHMIIVPFLFLFTTTCPSTVPHALARSHAPELCAYRILFSPLLPTLSLSSTP